MSEILRNNEEAAQALELSERVRMLFTFCTDLIPQIEMLERAEKEARQKANSVRSGYVLFTAMGEDADEIEMQWNIREMRAEALVNLLKTLKDTEEERKNFNENKIFKL